MKTVETNTRFKEEIKALQETIKRNEERFDSLVKEKVDAEVKILKRKITEDVIIFNLV
jgi:hypothetical protein